MSERVKLEMEFLINSSPAILFNFISTASGLSQWFADKVSVRGSELMIFSWGNEEVREAKIVKKAFNKFIRFAWSDADSKDEYWEMEICKGELTEDIMLYVTEFVDPDEEEEISNLWSSQIDDLKETLGVN
ncbi:MAG: START-like domain-containing protein [Bacteroidia bacterium]|nr:START-like domain-containing protein [Bacteroidia bacterium]